MFLLTRLRAQDARIVPAHVYALYVLPLKRVKTCGLISTHADPTQLIAELVLAYSIVRQVRVAYETVLAIFDAFATSPILKLPLHVFEEARVFTFFCVVDALPVKHLF